MLKDDYLDDLEKYGMKGGMLKRIAEKNGDTIDEACDKAIRFLREHGYEEDVNIYFRNKRKMNSYYSKMCNIYRDMISDSPEINKYKDLSTKEMSRRYFLDISYKFEA